MDAPSVRFSNKPDGTSACGRKGGIYATVKNNRTVSVARMSPQALHPGGDIRESHPRMSPATRAHTGYDYASVGAAFTACNAGSSSSEIRRMLASAVESGIPTQWVRIRRWLTPNSSQYGFSPA
jgi:hypothetical protein